MTTYVQNEGSRGFSLVEVGLVIVVLAVIGAVGVMFYQNSTHQKSSDTATANTPAAAAPAGTTASIDQLTQQDAAAESNIDSAADAQTVDNAASSNSAASNVGGAYDENNL